MFSIEEEFKKNPQLKNEDIDVFRKWMLEQPHLPNVSDHFFIMFLHSCDYDMEAAKKTIDNFFTIRSKAVEIFSNLDPNSKGVQEALKTMYMVKLPNKTPAGLDVFLTKLRRTDSAYYVMADTIKTSELFLDSWWKTNGTTAGIIHLLDSTGFSLGHLSKAKLSIVKHHSAYAQEALPVKLKAVHMLNILPIINMAMNIVKPFLKEETKKRIHYHPANDEKLYEYVPKSMLPKEYGGEAPSLEELNDQTKQMIIANEEWFKELEGKRVDESKRPGKRTKKETKISTGFQKLDID